MTLESKALALRVATHHLTYNSCTISLLRIPSLVEEILKLPQTVNHKELIDRIVVVLKEHLILVHLEETVVFLRKLANYLGPALQLEEQVEIGDHFFIPKILLEMDTPFDRKQLTQFKLPNLSDKARGEIVSFYRTGKVTFSPDTILEIRLQALMWHCKVLKDATLDQIKGMLLLSDKDVALLNTLWVFAYENDDGLLKACLFSNGPRDHCTIENITGENKTFEELQALEAMYLSHKFPNYRVDTDPHNTHLSLDLLEWSLQEGMKVRCLNFHSDDILLAVKLSEILLKYGTTTPLDSIAFYTTNKDVLAQLLPIILRLKVNELSLHNNTETGFENFESLSENDSLRSLSVYCKNELTPKGQRGLRNFIRQNRGLTFLTIKDEESRDSTTTLTLAPQIQCCSSLRDFDLRMRLGLKEIGPLSEMIEGNKGLTSLTLKMDGAALQKADVFAKALRNSNLRQLNLTIRPYDIAGLDRLLTEGLGRSPTLQTLKLHVADGNVPLDMRGFAQMVRTSASIQELTLNHNKMGDEGGELLVRALEGNSSLQTLQLSETDIGKRSFQALADLLRSSHSLRTLALRGGKFTDEHLELLGSGLAHNRSLSVLEMSEAFSYKAMASFAHQLGTNRSLIFAEFRDTYTHEEKEKLTAIFDQNGFSASFGLGVSKIERKIPPLEQL